jgi:hypothetical protein
MTRVCVVCQAIDDDSGPIRCEECGRTVPLVGEIGAGGIVRMVPEEWIEWTRKPNTDALDDLTVLPDGT